MYCSNCGNQIIGKLKYCNSCGDRLAKEEDRDGMPGKMLDNILTTLFLVVMFGFGILVGLVAVLLGNGVDPQAVGVISLVYLASVSFICFMLLWQVRKLIDARLNARKSELPDNSPLQFVPPNAAPRLEEYRQPASSVTDHTTRALEEVPLQRK
jgi:hypothetical protein